MADAGAIKNINIDTVRYSLRQFGAMSKTAIARQTGLSFPTISRAVDTLVDMGELVESGVEASTGGRCAKIYAINPSASLSLSVRLSGRGIFWFISNLIGERITEGQSEMGEDALSEIDKLCDGILARYPSLGAVSLGLSGIVSSGAVLVALEQEELSGISLAEHISGRLQLPAAVEGNRSLAALGLSFPDDFNPGSIVSIHTDSNGIGAGIVIGGAVWRGLSGFAGELAFLPSAQNEELAVNDPIGYFAEMVLSYVSTIAPDAVVFFDDTLSPDSITELYNRCAERLPEAAIPAISAAENFNGCCEEGLRAIGYNLVNGWSPN